MKNNLGLLHKFWITEKKIPYDSFLNFFSIFPTCIFQIIVIVLYIYFYILLLHLTLFHIDMSHVVS